jgi:hypothetical protein
VLTKTFEPAEMSLDEWDALPEDTVGELVGGRRDRVEKTTEYAAFGVRYYWIMDPQLRSLEILKLDASGLYTHVLGVSEGRLETIPGCEGLVLDLDVLWQRIERLEAQSRAEEADTTDP